MPHVHIVLFLFVDLPLSFFFFFNDTATTEIYTLSLHDALPISRQRHSHRAVPRRADRAHARRRPAARAAGRSEEHTSELQSRRDLVCRLLLEKKKKIKITVRVSAKDLNDIRDPFV